MMGSAEERTVFQSEYLNYDSVSKAEIRLEKFRIGRLQKRLGSFTNWEKFVIIVSIIAVCFFLMVTLVTQVLASSVNTEIYNYNREIDKLTGEIENLNVQLNSSKNLGDIENYATDQLAMSYPGKGQLVFVRNLASRSAIDGYVSDLSAKERGIVAENDVEGADAGRSLFTW